LGHDRYGTRQRSRLQHASCPFLPGRLCPAAAGACSLRHTYEGDPGFAALPTFAVIPAMGATDAVRMSSFLPRFNHVRARAALHLSYCVVLLQVADPPRISIAHTTAAMMSQGRLNLQSQA